MKKTLLKIRVQRNPKQDLCFVKLLVYRLNLEAFAGRGVYL